MPAGAESVRVPVAAGRQASGLLEDAAECGRVTVPGPAPHLVDWVTRGLQQALGVLDASVPQVGPGPAAGGRGEPAG